MHNIINDLLRECGHLFLNILNMLILIMQRLIIVNPLGPSSCFLPLKILALHYSLGLGLGLLRSLSRGVYEKLACWEFELPIPCYEL